jgi:hypothetical protein
VAFIRVGFFEDFKSADTLLIDVDRDGLHSLIAWLRGAISSDQKTTISDCPGSVVQAGLRVELLRSRDDTGILRTAEGAFVWQRSEDGWTDILKLLGRNGSGRLPSVPRRPAGRSAGDGEHWRVRRWLVEY